MVNAIQWLSPLAPLRKGKTVFKVPLTKGDSPNAEFSSLGIYP